MSPAARWVTSNRASATSSLRLTPSAASNVGWAASFDIHVTVAVALEVRADREDVRAALLDGFGIERLESVEYG